jgi:hypothetical protein
MEDLVGRYGAYVIPAWGISAAVRLLRPGLGSEVKLCCTWMPIEIVAWVSETGSLQFWFM